ncbi:hypothetical protein FJ420_27175 [Mesorhizobium sp. B3-1-3]|uniref:hypothetical protein n=1 Tax=unclassified Mesorhizobium TaxID=325217 RepID=UPI00112C4891|nr:MULTISPECIES: hypothetical protein [unclassified Mesorhizobium]TPI64852.1 hypothetical protein FJ420_27175 [Mesorhizobium sp. B3-1-3]TPI69638.1 hypothetical protein FJ424_05765 [Mesorhizobium sp. B3-1-8]
MPLRLIAGRERPSTWAAWYSKGPTSPICRSTRVVINWERATCFFQDISVKDFVALEIEDNLAVDARDPLALVEVYKKLDIRGIGTLVLSACVQMPSLAAVPKVEAECGVPVIAAAIATTHQMLRVLDLEAKLPNAGHLLSGACGQTRPRRT